MKPPIQYGKFGALCPTAVFLRLPVKKVRRLRDLGLVRLFGGLTRPEDLAEDWMQHAHRLIDQPAPTPRTTPWRGGGTGTRRVAPSRVPPVEHSYETWLALQGGEPRKQP